MTTANQYTGHPVTTGLDPSTTLIRMPEVQAIVGLSRPAIYRLMQQDHNTFPQPVQLSNSKARGAPVAWVLSEVQDWVRQRIKDRRRIR